MAKKVPMRTCIGCGRICEKKDLIRIVRTPEGEVLADSAGRAEGRGAYLCRDAECLAKARKRKAFGRAFRTAVDGGQYEKLRAQLEALNGGGIQPDPEPGEGDRDIGAQDVKAQR